MKKKFFTLLVACAFSLNVVGAAFAQAKAIENDSQAPSLAGLLPASDLVVTFNAQRFFNEALPQVLASNPPMLKDILSKMGEMKAQTGVDFKQFDQFALGVASKNVSATEITLEPVVLARGSFNPAALISLAKIALNGKVREEKLGDKTIYIFTPPPPKVVPLSKTPQAKTSVFEKAIDKMIADLSREFAVGSYDGNTLAIGSTARVRETMQSKTRADAEVLSVINRKPNALLSFGVRLPSGMSGLIHLENDEIGKNIDSIRQISGAMDVADGNATLSLVARTLKPEQSQGLRDTLAGLQMVGKTILGGSKKENEKVLGRIVSNARVSAEGSEVMLDLSVPQSDIDILIGVK